MWASGVTDSDDMKQTEYSVDQLKYYDVQLAGGFWYLQDFYGSDAWYINYVAGLKANPNDLPSGKPDPTGLSGVVWNDTNSNGRQDQDESGMADYMVFLDENGNGRWESTTQTFTSSDTNLAIKDLGRTVSTLDINTSITSISDINLTLDIEHTYDGDLSAYLVSPDGTQVLLFASVGGSGQNFTGTVFDDEALSGIAQGTAPFDGAFRPQRSLSDFDGMDPNGQWELRVYDSYKQDQGTLLQWSVEITSQEPFAMTDANGNYGFSDIEAGTCNLAVVVPDLIVSTTGSPVIVVVAEGSQETVDIGLHQLTAGELSYCQTLDDSGYSLDSIGNGRFHGESEVKLDARPQGSLTTPGTTIGPICKIRVRWVPDNPFHGETQASWTQSSRVFDADWGFDQALDDYSAATGSRATTPAAFDSPFAEPIGTVGASGTDATSGTDFVIAVCDDWRP